MRCMMQLSQIYREWLLRFRVDLQCCHLWEKLERIWVGKLHANINMITITHIIYFLIMTFFVDSYMKENSIGEKEVKWSYLIKYNKKLKK